jgi:hypothetical protein|tara:strand:- start:109 stop:591 length:483 start_codon:yes stop_codon:yes gene_type:complete
MANRILAGKNINSNHGHSSSSPGFGVYVSRPGKNVLSCTADELVLNTDNGQGTSISKVFSMFQLPPINSNNNASASNNVTSGATITIDLSSISFNFGFGFVGFGSVPLGNVSGTTGTATSVSFNTSTTSGAETLSVTNNGAATINSTLFLIPKFSNLAVF